MSTSAGAQPTQGGRATAEVLRPTRKDTTRRSIDDETIDDEESRISSRLDEEENGRGGVSINKECLDKEAPRASEVMKVVLDVVGEWWERSDCRR